MGLPRFLGSPLLKETTDDVSIDNY
jgi:hypothetical protein